MSCPTGLMDDDDDEVADTLIFLTLGDGDFSWSLDLARFLASNNTNLIGISSSYCKYRLIATGIDRLTDLSQKYRNSDYILRELKRTASSTNTANSHLSIQLCHEINAIVDCHDKNKLKDVSFPKANVVIFNHPHLGTEDAVLHSRFLCHLFDSINKVWLKPSPHGIVYLTLAKGQYERWNCEKAARSNGFQLYQRLSFHPTPIVNSCYEHRRHQTGKSFASRTCGSETFVFVRKNGDGNTLGSMLRLPWFQSRDTNADVNEKIEKHEFACLHCPKIFSEKRSLKNHMLSKHSEITDPDARRTKRTRDEYQDGSESFSQQRSFPCPYCENAREFLSTNALNDHIVAKHVSIHHSIPAERGLLNPHDRQTVGKESRFSCEICNAWFMDSQAADDHLKAFTPTSIQEIENVQCQFCAKIFREKRAQLQHENFCSYRRQNNFLELMPPALSVNENSH